MTDAIDDQDTNHGDVGDLDTADGFAKVDADVYAKRSDYPNAELKDFEEDTGDWSNEAYMMSAQRLFGAHAYYGDTAQKRYSDEGFARFEQNDLYAGEVERHAPGASQSLRFYRHSGRIVPRGFVTISALDLLRIKFPTADFGRVHVTVPARPEHVGDTLPPPGELPSSLRHVIPADNVDLRKYCSLVGDQRQTSRCAAFAWTHALEMAANIQGKAFPRLSCSYTMLQFQRRQGDFKDYQAAYKGGEGASGTWEPGQTLVDHGTCRHDYWGDDDETPKVPEKAMDEDSRTYRLDAQVMDIQADELRKVLTAGCPVLFTMDAGVGFSEIGRDGLFSPASRPSGRHGCHAMLLVGYVGNFFIVKNSWGLAFGDGGYCYMPRKVLVKAKPDFTAILLTKPGTVRKPVKLKPRTDSHSAAWAAAIAPRPSAMPPASLRAPRPVSAPLARSIEEPPPVSVPVPSLGGASIEVELDSAVGSARAEVSRADWVSCPACAVSTPHAAFCTGCGTKFVRKRFCTECGGNLKADLNFCEQCGAATA